MYPPSFWIWSFQTTQHRTAFKWYPNTIPRTERLCMKCHRFLFLGCWGFGENFFYWGFVLAFCNWCFTTKNFWIWCKGKSETAVYHATCHIDEYQFLLVDNLNYCLRVSCCNSGCMWYCVWSSFYISAASQISIYMLIQHYF